MFQFLKPRLKKIPQSVIGIDIHSSAVSLLELSCHEGQYCVEGYARQRLLPNVIKLHSIQDVGAISNTIQALRSHVTSSPKQVILAVPSATTINKWLQISASLPESDIEEAVLLVAEKDIPYPLDEINLDFNIIGLSKTHPAMLDVLVVACRSRHVNQRIEAVRNAGILVNVVDVDVCAIERVLHYCVDSLPNKHHGILVYLNIKEHSVDFLIYDEWQILVSHEETLNDVRLLQFNLLFNQIKRMLNYLLSTIPHKQMKHLILTSCVHLPDLAHHLSLDLNVQIHLADPFSQMTYSKKVDRDAIKRDNSLLMTVCGLALRGYPGKI